MDPHDGLGGSQGGTAGDGKQRDHASDGGRLSCSPPTNPSSPSLQDLSSRSTPFQFAKRAKPNYLSKPTVTSLSNPSDPLNGAKEKDDFRLRLPSQKI
jgi:hypothetical protein